MVINCIPEPKRKGEMLVKYTQHLRIDGYLFLILPLSCLTHSSKTTKRSFLEILGAVGLEVVTQKDTPKVAFFVCKRVRAEIITASSSSSTSIHKRAGGQSWTNDFWVDISEEK